jgi:hypothetical protein
VVEVSSGRIRGFKRNGGYIFKGCAIRCADLRFQTFPASRGS